MTDVNRNDADHGGVPSHQHQTAAVLGDSRLHQVREFLEDSPPPAVNPIGFLARAMRGRMIKASVLCALLAVVFGVAGYHAISPKFQSQGLIRVAARVPKVMYADPNDPRLRLFDSFVSAEVTYLKSRPVLERTLQSLNASIPAGDNPQIDVSDLAQMVGIRKDKGLITVSAVSSQPIVASAVVNTLLQSYTDLHAESSDQAQSIRERQLIQREQELFSKLQDLKKESLTVGEEHGTTSIAKAHLNKVTQLEDVDQRLSELETTIAQVEAKDSTTEFDTGDDEIKRVTVLDQAMADMTYDRAKRAANLEAFKLRYSADNPKVKELIREIAVIDSAIEARRQQIVTLGKTGALTGGSEQKDEDSLAGLLLLKEKLASRRDQVAEEAKALNNKLIQLTFLREEYVEVRNLLDETRRALEEVRVESRTDLPGSVEVISTGAVPKKPMEDKRKKVAVAGAGFGFMSGFGLFLLGSLVRPRIRFSDDLVNAVGEPNILGALPGIEEDGIEFENAIHRMRNRLQLADILPASTDQGIVLAVCSTAADAGATTVARALADSFSISGMKTCIIDGNLNSPGLTHALSMQGNTGLRDAVADKESEIEEYIIDTGTYSILPTGLDQTIGDQNLSLSRMRQVVSQARMNRDIVIIDAGPYEGNLSANLMTSLANQVLVVSRSGVDTSTVKRISKWLESGTNRAPFFAINAVPAKDPGLLPASTINTLPSLQHSDA